MIVPSAHNFKDEFPLFETLSDAAVEFQLIDASRNVDDTWFEQDRVPAVMWLAAHYLSALSSPSAALGASVVGPLKSKSLGDAAEEYSDAHVTAGATADDTASTMYGRRYLEILKRNHPAVVGT